MSKLPADRSCRPSHGGCGRPVVVVREKSEVTKYRLSPKEVERQVAVHDDEVNGRPIVKNPTQYAALRIKLEMRCAAQQERQKDAVGITTEVSI